MSHALPRVFAALALGLAANLALAADGSAPKNAASEYVAPQSLDLTKLLPKQTADDSKETRAELDQMLQIQARRTRADCAASLEDQDIGGARFAAMLGFPHGLPESGIDTFKSLLERASKLEIAVIHDAKEAFARPRPFMTDPALQPCIERPSNGSYPSGHAAWAYMTALILADMFPDRKTAIMDRAEEFAWHRVIGGVHYPSDIAAGRESGKLLADKLFASQQFRTDEAAARQEIEAARKSASH